MPQVEDVGATRLGLPRVVLGSRWHGLQGDESARTRLVLDAIDLGIDAIDTAPLYDFGGIEAELGRALRGRREEVLLLTKVGLRWDDDYGQVFFESTIDGRRRCVRRDSRPGSVRRDVEESLTRLQTDVLDLVQVHQLDARTPVAETIGELVRLRQEGKLRFLGVSNFPVQALRQAVDEAGEGGLATAQEAFSLVERTIEAEVLPCLGELGVSLLAYSPLASGILAGRMLGRESERVESRGALFHPRNVARIHGPLRKLVLPMAAEKNVSLGSIALAWILHQPGAPSVICGASSREQIADNLRAADVELTGSEREALADAFGSLPLERQPGLSVRDRIQRFLRRRAGELRRRFARRSG